MRFNVVETPIQLPGACKTCGSADREYYVDFGYKEAMYGHIYICNECITEISTICGFLTPGEKSKLVNQVSNLRNELTHAKKRASRLEDLENAVKEFQLLDDSVPSDFAGATDRPNDVLSSISPE